jgi:NAD(P)-dependent dehydrogenase (short-subunit alcohol dehydrogenase family)
MTGSHRFGGWTIAVTGGASGIGSAIARGFAAEGGHVALLDIAAEAAARLAEDLREGGGSARAYRCDVGSEHEVDSVFTRVVADMGPVRVLVNNAFTMPARSKPEVASLDEWKRSLAVNLTGYFLCAKAAARSMIAGGGGSIVNLSSIGGSTSLGRGNLAYGVAKAGILQLTRELAVEWAEYGIRVNAVQPCQTMTAALRAMLEGPDVDRDQLLATLLRGIPLGRLAGPEDIVGPVLFLASDAAAMVTGATLPVDGGNLALNAGGSPSW